MVNISRVKILSPTYIFSVKYFKFQLIFSSTFQIFFSKKQRCVQCFHYGGNRVKNSPSPMFNHVHKNILMNYHPVQNFRREYSQKQNIAPDIQ